MDFILKLESIKFSSPQYKILSNNQKLIDMKRAEANLVKVYIQLLTVNLTFLSIKI